VKAMTLPRQSIASSIASFASAESVCVVGKSVTTHGPKHFSLTHCCYA